MTAAQTNEARTTEAIAFVVAKRVCLGLQAVTKLDRRARSLPDARDIVEELIRPRDVTAARRVGARPDRPGRTRLFNALATVAEFEADLIKARPREAWRWPGPSASSAAH